MPYALLAYPRAELLVVGEPRSVGEPYFIADLHPVAENYQKRGT